MNKVMSVVTLVQVARKAGGVTGPLMTNSFFSEVSGAVKKKTVAFLHLEFSALQPIGAHHFPAVHTLSFTEQPLQG